MKINEAIDQLHGIMTEYGDLEVVLIKKEKDSWLIEHDKIFQTVNFHEGHKISSYCGFIDQQNTFTSLLMH